MGYYENMIAIIRILDFYAMFPLNCDVSILSLRDALDLDNSTIAGRNGLKT